MRSHGWYVWQHSLIGSFSSGRETKRGFQGADSWFWVRCWRLNAPLPAAAGRCDGCRPSEENQLWTSRAERVSHGLEEKWKESRKITKGEVSLNSPKASIRSFLLLCLLTYCSNIHVSPNTFPGSVYPPQNNTNRAATRHYLGVVLSSNYSIPAKITSRGLQIWWRFEPETALLQNWTEAEGKEDKNESELPRWRFFPAVVQLHAFFILDLSKPKLTLIRSAPKICSERR